MLLETALQSLVHAGWQAAVLAGIVLVIGWTAGHRIPPSWRCALWLVVLMRLAVPVLPASPWSFFQLTSIAEARFKTAHSRLRGNHEPMTDESAFPENVEIEVSGEPVVGGDDRGDDAGLAPGAVDGPSSRWPLLGDQAGAGVSFSLHRWLAMTWFVGATVLLSRCFWTQARLSWTRRSWSEVTVPAVVALFETCRVEVRTSQAVRLRLAEGVGPAVTGVWRSHLVLPPSALQSLSSEELRFVFLHELIHVRRRDVLIDFLATVVVAVHWFNPLAWIALRYQRHEREMACDAAVLDLLGNHQRRRYGHVVLKLARQLIVPNPLPSAVGVFGRGFSLKRRIAMIAGYRAPSRKASFGGAVLLALLIAGGLTDAQERLVQVGAARDEEAITPLPAVSSEVATPTEQDKLLSGAIARGIDYLQTRQQKPEGSWPEFTGQPGGLTALCTLALLNAGVDPRDDSIQSSLGFLRSLGNPRMTYATALQTMVFCAAEPEKDLPLIQQNVRWLEQIQFEAGDRAGAWGYGPGLGMGDNSNSRFAMMALHEAERVGVEVEEQVWRRALDYWTRTQGPDGGWGYFAGMPATGSMTCAGIAAVVIAAEKLEGEHVVEQKQASINQGLKWLATNFSVEKSPGRLSPTDFRFYYLHSLAQMGQLSGQQHVGPHDWRREGTQFLLAQQDPLSHHWLGAGSESNPLVATSLALLFLARK